MRKKKWDNKGSLVIGMLTIGLLIGGRIGMQAEETVATVETVTTEATATTVETVTAEAIVTTATTEATATTVSSTEEATSNANNALTSEEYAAFDINEYEPYEFDEESEWDPLGDYYSEQNSILYMSSYDCVGDQDYPTEAYFMNMVEESSAEAFALESMMEDQISESLSRYEEEYDEKIVYVRNSSGIDINGDGTDELLEVSLVRYLSGDDTSNVYNEVVIYQLNSATGDYEILDASVNTMSNMISDNVSDLMEIASSMNNAFVAVAAGDYDKDGQEEGAIYVADESAPYVMIIDIDEDGMYESQRIYLKDIDTNFDGTFSIPTEDSLSVSLSTTQISGQDDLVINMSLAGEGKDSTIEEHTSVSHNSVTAIYRDMGSELGNIYKRVFDSSNGERMRYVASVDSDVNGNGVGELLIGGHIESGFTEGVNEIGSISEDSNALFMLVWNASTYSYEEVWSDPVVVEAHSEDITISNTNVAPVAITAATYIDETTEVFLEGVVFSFEGYEIEESYEASEGTEIEDTDECALLVDGTFEQIYEIDLDDEYERGNEYFIDTATTAHFVDGSLMEQTVIVTGVANATYQYPVNYSVHWLWGEDGEIQECYGTLNYMEDASTALLPAFLTFTALDYYDLAFNVKYTGKEYGWSEPEVYSVVKSIPYWSELLDSEVNPGYISYTLEIGTQDEEAIGLNDYINMSEEMAIKLQSAEYSDDEGVEEVLAHLKLWKAINEYEADTTVEINAMEDMVILVVSPIVQYCYEIDLPAYVVTQEDVENYKSANGGICSYQAGDVLPSSTEEIAVYSQLPTNYTAVTLDEYNELVAEYPDLQLEQISASTLYEDEVVGDPTTYPDVDTWSNVSGREDALISTNVIRVTDADDAELQFAFDKDENESIEIAFSLTYADELNSAESATYEVQSDEGVIDFTNILEAEEIYTMYSSFQGIDISGELSSLSAITLEGLQKSYDLDTYYDYEIRTGIYESDGMYILDYMVEGIDDESAPPVVPENFLVYMTSDTECMLMWETPENRLADTYEIMQLNGQQMELIDTIDATQNYYVVDGLTPGTSYQFAIRAVKAADDTAGYIERKVISEWTYGTTSDSGDEVQPSIITEPTNTRLTVDSIGVLEAQSVTFSVVAQAGEGYGDSDLRYQWQEFDSATGKWSNISGENDTTYTIEITADNMAEMNTYYTDTGYYRVVVVQGSEMVVSRVATLVRSTEVLSEVELDLTLSSTADISTCDELQFIDEASVLTMTVDIVGEDADVIAEMDGTVTFVGIQEDTSTVQTFGTATIENGEASCTYDSKSIEVGVYQVYAYYTGEIVAVGSANYQVVGTISNEVQMDYGYVTQGVYHISYYMDGGINGAGNATVVIADGEDVILEPALDQETSSGVKIAEFAGWYTDEEYKNPLTDNTIEVAGLTADVRIYAKYEYTEYSITYELGDEDAKNTILNPSTYTYEDLSIFLSSKATRTGYTFEGWYTDEELTNKVSFISKSMLGDITLYAKWTLNMRTVTYCLGGGTNSTDNPTSYTVIDGDIDLEMPMRSGFYFKGWYIDPTYLTEIQSIDTDAIEEIVIHATWSNYCEETTLEKSGDVYLIQSFDDLNEMARVVAADPYTYAYATYKITTEINCSGKTLDQPIGTETSPFNGTVYGNSNLIYNLVLPETEGATGIFGVVGTLGELSNILTCKIKYSGDADTVGALVGINYGIVDNCDTGIYVLGTYGYSFKSDNTILSGNNIVGGLVGENKKSGSILNSSSSAQVTSDYIAGGLVGQNAGTIQNAYNLGAITTTSSSGIAGGLVGENLTTGSIYNVYHAGEVSGSDQCGDIIGVSANTDFTMCYDSGNLDACSNQDTDEDTDIDTDMTKSTMKSSSFTKTLNANCDGTTLGTWLSSMWYTGYYPSIKSGSYVSTTVYSSSARMTMSAVMPESAEVTFTDVEEETEQWEALDAVVTGVTQTAEDVEVIAIDEAVKEEVETSLEEAGKEILWAKEIEVTHEDDQDLAVNVGAILIECEIPDGVVEDSVTFLMVDWDGEVIAYENQSTEDGMYKVMLPYIATCAFVGEVEEGAEVEFEDTEADTEADTGEDTDVVDTGDDSKPQVWILLSILSIVGGILYRKNRKELKY